jgi:hypothetical protein
MKLLVLAATTLALAVPFLRAQVEAIDPELAAKLLVAAIESGQWWLTLGPVVALIVWFLRAKLAPKFPKFDAFLQKPVVAFITPILVAFLGGVLSKTAAGELTSASALLGIIPDVLKVAFTAIATYVGIKKVAEQRADSKAKAEAQVPPGDTQAAVDSITKP